MINNEPEQAEASQVRARVVGSRGGWARGIALRVWVQHRQGTGQDCLLHIRNGKSIGVRRKERSKRGEERERKGNREEKMYLVGCRPVAARRRS